VFNELVNQSKTDLSGRTPPNVGHMSSGGFSKHLTVNQGRNYNRITALGNPQTPPLLICHVTCRSYSIFSYLSLYFRTLHLLI
jgi:hypothetical protein